MTTVRRFEDLKCWQVARELNKTVHTIVRGSSAFRDQTHRASLSIMANIAEGFSRKSDKEFMNFLSIAHGSAGELQSHLAAAFDCGSISRTEYDTTFILAERCSQLIQGLSNYLRRAQALRR